MGEAGCLPAMRSRRSPSGLVAVAGAGRGRFNGFNRAFDRRAGVIDVYTVDTLTEIFGPRNRGRGPR